MTRFKLALDDIKLKQENALDLFYSGIKAEQTKDSMDRILRNFLVDVCADLLQGDYRQRTQQFVNIAKEDQERAVGIVLAYVRILRERTRLDKADPNYLNPSSLPNKIKPIKKLVEMNGLGLGWKRIQATYPEKDNIHEGRGYTREEIKKMLEYSADIVTDFVILAMSSGGFRLGAWNGLTWDCVFPVYDVNEEYKTELRESEIPIAKVVCGGMTIYKGTPEKYVALISIEAWNKLQEYKNVWIKKMRREPIDSDPVLLEIYTKPKPMTDIAIKKRIEEVLHKSGIRTPLLEGKRRHTVPMLNGFRRYWDKVMMESMKNKESLSALVKKERLMGHYGLVQTDKNYFWVNKLELVPEYLEAMPELMMNDEHRLKQKLELEKSKSEKLEKENELKNEILLKMKELEAKVRRMEKYQVST